jgi:hypothetical protein
MTESFPFAFTAVSAGGVVTAGGMALESLAIVAVSGVCLVVSATGRLEPAACLEISCARGVIRASSKQPVKQIITFFIGLVLKIHP